MLRLEHICKDYISDAGTVHALRDVSLNFRESEFVAVLGPSGCGKTTLLNIVGGLDRFTSGDLVINGTSTCRFGEKDWNAYRNHSVGFVFQSYNLIPHLDALSNVEMALKVSGVDRSQRSKLATDALARVGLADQLHKKPSQMSGGQMQRVAIARALVNSPSIILADEPTGALDSETSVQVMDILAEVARDHLVIMVTHDPELAEEYATRTIRLKDGEVRDDTNPPNPSEISEEKGSSSLGHAKLGFFTALGLSAKNLLTKKGRTLLTSFAGAIGIIGIALILALSSGMNDYIASIEHDTMGSYPIELEAETIDMTSVMGARAGGPAAAFGHGAGNSQEGNGETGLSQDAADEGLISSNNVMADAVKASQSMMVENDLGMFRSYLEANRSSIEDSVSAVEYGYDATPQVFRLDGEDEVALVSPSTLDANTGIAHGMQTSMGMSNATSSVWTQMPRNAELIESSYELVAGSWPQGQGEAALVLDQEGAVSDYVLYTLGLLPIEEMDAMVDAIRNGEDYDDEPSQVAYDDALGRTYKVLARCDLYEQDEDGIWYDASEDESFMREAYGQGADVTITAVLRLTEDSRAKSGAAYTWELTEELIGHTAESSIVVQQLNAPEINVLTGKPFEGEADEAAASDGNVDQAASSEDSVVQTASSTSTRQPTRPASLGGTPGNVQPTTMPAGVYAAAGVSTAREAPAPKEIPDEGEDADGEQPATCTVKFSNYDGEIISENTYETGTEVVAPAEAPIRAPTETSSYSFIGWMSKTDDPATDGKFYPLGSELPKATGDATYTAFYHEIPLPPTTEPSIPGAPIMPNMPGVPGSSSLAFPQGMQGMPVNPEAIAGMGGIDYASLMAQAPDALSSGQMSALLASLSDSIPSTLDEMLEALGYATVENPSSIAIYPTDFTGKEVVESFIASYNDQAPEDSRVTYTDLVGIMTSSLSTIVDMISAVLIAFVTISLVVSSIMIAIITYISVLERTREIGVLRAIGASKRDVSKIFNAETVIEGLLSGLVGVGAALLICIPVNSVISSMFGVDGVASLPPAYGALLVGISVLLTVIAGFIPSRMAAKKEPAIALRAE